MACFAAATLMAADEDRGPRPPVPIDDLPRPLVRQVQAGAEELAEGWNASDAEVALGRRLFFEARLSNNDSVACASCHRPEFAFADDRQFSLGVDDQPTLFNSPSLLNKSLSENVLWDGRAPRIEDQVLMPIDNPLEMALGVENAVQGLAADEEYAKHFQDVYASPPTRENLASALSAFVRALTVANSPVDRFRKGAATELTASEQAGLWLFEGRGQCWRCHNGPNFSDESFHNTGVGSTDGVPESGRGAITEDAADLGKFRTPGLRMLTKTAPYMHDGSMKSLQEVVEFYRDGGRANSNLSKDIRELRLSDEDVQNLVAFLEALSKQ